MRRVGARRVTRIAIVVMGMAACGRTSAAPGGAATTTLVCEQTSTSLAVGAPLKLAEAHCAAAWETLQFNLSRTTEVIRREPGLEVWLTANGKQVDAEIRAPGRRSLHFRAIKQITQRAAKPRTEHSLAISSAGEVSTVPFRELKQRYRPATPSGDRKDDGDGDGNGGGDGDGTGKGNEGSGKEISLCALARDYGKPTPGGASTIKVIAKDEAPLTFTAAECAAKRLVLRFSSKGEVRLRSEGGAERYLQVVTRIEL